MKQSPQIQSRINDVAKDLVNGKERAEILRKYAKKWQIAERTIDRYLTSAKPIAKSMADLKDKTVKEAIVSVTTEAVKQGLKSKFDRVMLLQGEIYKCLDELYNPEIDNFADIGSSRKNVKKQLTVMEKVKIRQVMNQLQSEISKIEGDYAPEESKVTVNGFLDFLKETSNDK